MKRIALVIFVLVAGCGSGNPTPSPDSGTTPDMAMANPIALACTDTLDSVYQLPMGLPAYDATHRGDVIRCAFDRKITAAQLNAAVTADGYKGPPLPSGASVYRIAYRTDRLESIQPNAGVSSALVLLPDVPRPGVLVVAGHGTVGLAPGCPDSHDDLTGSAANSARVMFLGFVGYGYMTIAPDYAGFGYGSTSGWSLAEDEAHSLLDATRAMKKLIVPAALPGKVVIAGHSQGGHAVLSAQALAQAYGLEGQLVGIVGFAPLWLPSRTWGAALAVGLNTATDGGAIAFLLHYFYGHGELYDGPGGGVAMIQPGKRQMVQDLMTKQCLDDLEKQLPTLGKSPADFFDATFLNDVSSCAAFDTCMPANAALWQTRFRADRPAINGKGAPIVVWQGLMDNTIVPTRAQCGFDKIGADLKAAAPATATLTLCSDPTGDHGGVVRNDIDWVNQWIDARANGKPEPPACAAWAPVTCATPPPNVD